MASPSNAPDLRQPALLLEEFGPGRQRGQMLRRQLAERFPGRPADEVEDAVQTACQKFLGNADAAGFTEPARAYAWLRTAAYREMVHELEGHTRTIAADPTGALLEGEASDQPDPVAELLEIEEQAELKILVEEVSSKLSDSRRQVFALWAAGRKRPEIAEQLGLSDRAVKKALEEVMRSAREVLTRRTGGGCAEGESLVLRMTCGLAAAGEEVRARLHLQHCGRCSSFSEELAAWKDKVPAVLPPVAIEVARPGLFGRAVGRVGEAVGSTKRHVLDGGTLVKQQAAMTTYGRAADPTPLTGARPGTVVAVVAGCLAIGGGAATICAQPGVDPIGAAKDLIAGTSEEPAQEPAQPKSEEPAPPPAQEEPSEEPAVTPVYAPAEESREPEESSSASGPSEAQGKEETSPKEEKASSVEHAVSEPEEVVVEEATPPPPEQSFEPSSPEYPAVESSPSTSSSSASTSSSSPSSSSSGSESSSSKAEPAAVPKNEATQFGGP